MSQSTTATTSEECEYECEYECECVRPPTAHRVEIGQDIGAANLALQIRLVDQGIEELPRPPPTRIRRCTGNGRGVWRV